MPAIKIEEAQFQKILQRNLMLPLVTGVLSSVLFVAVVMYLLDSMRAIGETQRVIGHTVELGRLAAEGENGLRGYVITGDARFMDTYDVAQPLFKAELEGLEQAHSSTPGLPDRLRRIQAEYGQWAAFARDTAELRRQDPGAATERIASGQGKRLTDAMREELSAIGDAEQKSLADRTRHAETMGLLLSIGFVVTLLGFKGLLVFFGRRDLVGLSGRYSSALRQHAEHNAYLEAQGWLREGQNELGRALSGQADMRQLARATLDFLSARLGAVVGVLYAVDDDGVARRLAAFGVSPAFEVDRAVVGPEQTLIAQAVSSGRMQKVSPIPAGYLQVSSGVAEGPAAGALVAPVANEGRVNAVVELGFMREPAARDAELLELVAPLLGSALQVAQSRERQRHLLQDTQQLNERLQVQQEELRTTNEELEEQSRALKESQANLETQQAELEQTNLQVSEFAGRLEAQRDALQKAQSELEQRASELQRASQYKSEFLANMSHELRTPLNSSLILAKLLADNAKGNLDEEQVKFARSIYSSGNDLLSLINDILDIAKVEAGKLEVRPEATHLAAVAEGIRSTFEPMAQRKGLALDVLVGPDVPAQIITDSMRLEQILRNLVGNAVKFTEHGTVALHVTRRVPASVAFEVRDTGPGIGPAQHELVFEAFRQADGTTNRRHGGTGLGLSISRDLARLLGGDITLASIPGQGSTFTLVLPVELVAPVQQPVPSLPPQRAVPLPATAAPRPTSAPLPVPPPFADDRDEAPAGRRTVLVVEDDADFADILFRLARELGYRCLVAHQAEEGWRLAQQQTPDAVLLDMQLPDNSGLSVLQRLKDDPRTRHIPVHVVSVDDYAETALQLGAVGYAMKPTTREELRHVFDRLETKLSQKLKRVLLVEDDPRQQESVAHLIAGDDVQITAVSLGQEALQALENGVFDCMVTDLTLPDMSGQELLRRMSAGESRSFPPVIVYTGRNLTRDEETELLRYSRSIIIKGARSPERLLDEVTLFLHKLESNLSSEQQRMLRTARNRDRAFESRRIMVVDDDVRNIFALTSALEQKGATVLTARNGREALDKLERGDGVDLVLMDIMMPEMDGYTAMREIRRNPAWHRLPIIAVTAKAMKEDQQKSLDAGANDYLPKPIDLDRLFSLMRVWMPKLERI
jgi:CheY-like chemotaxis protein/CHASE3 domain sensor protein